MSRWWKTVVTGKGYDRSKYHQKFITREGRLSEGELIGQFFFSTVGMYPFYTLRDFGQKMGTTIVVEVQMGRPGLYRDFEAIAGVISAVPQTMVNGDTVHVVQGFALNTDYLGAYPGITCNALLDALIEKLEGWLYIPVSMLGATSDQKRDALKEIEDVLRMKGFITVNECIHRQELDKIHFDGEWECSHVNVGVPSLANPKMSRSLGCNCYTYARNLGKIEGRKFPDRYPTFEDALYMYFGIPVGCDESIKIEAFRQYFSQ